MVAAHDNDEQALVALANAGDARGFDGMYRRHRDWVLGLAWRFCGNEADALDVMQQSFEYLFAQFPGFVLSSHLRAYLYPVVKHQSITLVRKRRKLVSLAEFRDSERDAQLPWRWSDDESGDLERMLESLPAEQQEVLRLRFAADFKLQEIAESLGIALGTVKSRLHNALKQLKNLKF